METKFIILRSNNCNGYWSYYSEFKERDRYIVDRFGDRFLNTDVKDAKRFDTREDALKEIEGFIELVDTEMGGTERHVNFIGAGTYKIEEIYVHPVPEVQVVKNISVLEDKTV